MHRLPEVVREFVATGRIPSPPEVLVHLMRAMEDEASSIADLAQIVSQDPGLTSRILSVANSPALRRAKELTTIEDCLTSIGIRLVRALVTCLSIQRLFDKDNQLASAEVADFWCHSLLVGELARGIAEQAGLKNPDDAYLSGLLHDIGELILLQAIGDPYRQFLANVSAHPSLTADEEQLFGTTHGEVGAWLIAHWGLNSVLGDGIAFHHARATEIAAATVLPQAVWLAQALTALEEDAVEYGALIERTALSIDQAALAATRARAVERTRQIVEAMGIAVAAEFPQRAIQQVPATSAPVMALSPADSELSVMVGGMALLQPLQQDLLQLGNVKEVLLALRESARILFELPSMAILLVDASGTVLTGDGVDDQPSLFCHLSIPLAPAGCLAAAAVADRQVSASFASTQPLALLDQQLVRALSAEGLLCIPMVARQRTVGVILCGLSSQQYAGLQRRIPWLSHFGKIAALSLDVVLVAEQQQQQAEEERSQQFTRHARQIVHEAGNPLGIIKSYLKILERKLPEDGVRQELGILTEEIDRVAAIVGKMADDQAQHAARQSIDLAGVLSDFLALYADPHSNKKGSGLKSKCPRLKSLPLWGATVSSRSCSISGRTHQRHWGRASWSKLP
nr:HDOD domain-containing protein [Comamonas jiangduensis]